MNTQIWEYVLNITSEQIVRIPKGSLIRCVQAQNEKPVIWAQVDTEAELEDVQLLIYGTRHPIPEDGYFGMQHRYIGTFQLLGGKFVGHLFEREKIKYPNL